ncbi:unnamed protein product [Symbiodinium sp. KB8]|nr:unnamed protein product [Symbiodinium sp. KB8]
MCEGNNSQMEPMVMMKRGSVLPASVVEEILTSAAAASAEAPNRALKRRVRQRLHKKLGSMLTAEEFEKAMNRYSAMEEEASNLSQASASPSSNESESPCAAMLPNLSAGNSSNMCPTGNAPQTFIAVPMMMPLAMGQMQPMQPMLQPIQPVQPMGPIMQPLRPAQPMQAMQAQPMPVMQAMQAQPMPAPAMMQLLSTDAPAPSPKSQNMPVDEVSEDISQTASTIADDNGDDDDDELESISELSTEWARAVSQGSSEFPVERTFIQFHTRVSGSHRRSRSV